MSNTPLVEGPGRPLLPEGLIGVKSEPGAALARVHEGEQRFCLGELLPGLGDTERAWNGYRKTLYAFLKISQPEEAAAALERLRSLGMTLTLERAEAVRTLEYASARSRRARG
jgi:hypothetical protein